MSKLLGKDLNLGDTVCVAEGTYDHAMVFRIEKDAIHLRRPYMTHADFSYTGGVITYMGLEEFRDLAQHNCHTHPKGSRAEMSYPVSVNVEATEKRSGCTTS